MINSKKKTKIAFLRPLFNKKKIFLLYFMLIFHLCAKTFLRNFIDSLGSLNSMRIHAIFKRKSLKQKKIQKIESQSR